MDFVLLIIAILLITIVLETLAYVGISELFNSMRKKVSPKDPLTLGYQLFTVMGESFKLSRKIKDSSEILDAEFIAETNRTPISVIITLVLVIFWCITGIVEYVTEFNMVLFVILMCVELAIAIVVGVKLSGKNNDDDFVAKKCMRCKISNFSTYNTIRIRYRTFATVRLPDGSRYKMIPVSNYIMRNRKEKAVDVDINCVVCYDYLPFARCVIGPKELPKLKSWRRG